MDTIFALSSGSPPSGVAVIRISGPASRFVVETMCGSVPEPRRAVVRQIRHPRGGEVIDEGICLWFPGPASFCGEDSVELQLHGGPAVVRAALEAVGAMEGLRLAEAGEFTRRAFENGRLDLTEVEGLADLVAAQTETQRRQALDQASGEMRERLELWRETIVRLRALVEADFDFAEEEDVPDSVAAKVWNEAGRLAGEIRAGLDDDNRGEIIREGFEVMLMGRPNAGKSSLMNALAGRDVAIVTEEPGTTRDLIEVHLDLGGYPVTVVDTAGLREVSGRIEKEGIRRAEERARKAHLIVWLCPVDEVPSSDIGERFEQPVLVVRSKDDSGEWGSGGVSVRREGGMEALASAIAERVRQRLGTGESVLVTRERHRRNIERCVEALERAASEGEAGGELRAESLREAGEWLGRTTGRVDIEELLDVIFREFCVGK